MCVCVRERAKVLYIHVGIKVKKIKKKTTFVRKLATQYTQQSNAIATRKKENVAKKAGCVSPWAGSEESVEYIAYAPKLGIMTDANVNQKPPKVENTRAGKVLPVKKMSYRISMKVLRSKLTKNPF